MIVQKEENWYVAKCVENSVDSQGKTIEESIENLREALELYFEDVAPDNLNLPTFVFKFLCSFLYCIKKLLYKIIDLTFYRSSYFLSHMHQ